MVVFWFVLGFGAFWAGVVSGFVCFVVLFGFFSIGFLITEDLISVCKSNY